MVFVYTKQYHLRPFCRSPNDSLHNENFYVFYPFSCTMAMSCIWQCTLCVTSIVVSVAMTLAYKSVLLIIFANVYFVFFPHFGRVEDLSISMPTPWKLVLLVIVRNKEVLLLIDQHVDSHVWMTNLAPCVLMEDISANDASHLWWMPILYYTKENTTINGSPFIVNVWNNVCSNKKTYSRTPTSTKEMSMATF